MQASRSFFTVDLALRNRGIMKVVAAAAEEPINFFLVRSMFIIPSGLSFECADAPDASNKLGLSALLTRDRGPNTAI
jgi:hypothetical protein